MNDQLGRAIESWLKATDPVPGDIGRATAAIETEAAATPQRGRWWPLPTTSRRLTAPGQPRGRTMISAVKLFTAGVIVALFGGLALAGLPISPPAEEAPAAIASPSTSSAPATQAPSSSPATQAAEVRTDLIPGVELTAEEVEPGTFRVLSDGVRELSHPTPELGERDELITGLDGSVWLREDRDLTRLGDQAPLTLPQDPGRIEISREGTLWFVGEGPRLYSYDDRGPQLRFDGSDVAKAISLRLTADDDVWALLSTDRPGRYRLRHYDGSHWVRQPRPPAPADLPEARLEAWAVGDDGTSWAIRRGLLSYFDGQRWTAKVPYKRGPCDFVQLSDGGALALHDPIDGPVVLGSFPVDGSPERLRIPSVPGWEPDVSWNDNPVWALAPDRAVWRSLTETSYRPGDGPAFGDIFLTDCAGLARFDGESWTRYLPGRCVAEIDFGPDGSVWTRASSTTPGPLVTADPWADEEFAGIELETLVAGPLELYVITPEGVAGS